ncbi:MAG: molecular chaperone DnaJ [Rhodospirillaceae bacterium]|nr:molecular chaperone DnaJ [Rhodospirillaceae bacterium]
MLPSFLLGLLILGGVLYFLAWYGRAKTEDVKKTMRWTGISIGLLLVAVLALSGRLSVAIAALMGLVAWGWRVFNMIQMGQQMSGMFRNFARGLGGAGGKGSSDVQSAYLRMTLDHDTGHLDGSVVQGAFIGRKLSALSFEELITFLAEIRADVESAALLESFLDRAHPDWRARSHQGASANAGTPTASTAMTTSEALQILGLSQDAKAEDIKSAYRRLMTQLHPDRGGSDYLAAKINAAKDFLLKG